MPVVSYSDIDCKIVISGKVPKAKKSRVVKACAAAVSDIVSPYIITLNEVVKHLPNATIMNGVTLAKNPRVTLRRIDNLSTENYFLVSVDIRETYKSDDW